MNWKKLHPTAESGSDVEVTKDPSDMLGTEKSNTMVIEPTVVEPEEAEEAPEVVNPPVEAEPAPEEGQPAEPEEDKVDEARVKREEFFQTKYERMRARLREKDPALAAELDTEVKTGEPITNEDGDPKTMLEMTHEELTATMVDANRKALLTIRAEENFAREKVEWEKEVSDVRVDVSELAEALGLDEKAFKAAKTRADAYFTDAAKTVSGGPTRYGMAIAGEMQRIAQQQGSKKTITPAAAAEADRIRLATLAAQPAKASPGQPAPQGQKQKLLAEMQATAPKTTASLLGSGQ